MMAILAGVSLVVVGTLIYLGAYKYARARENRYKLVYDTSPAHWNAVRIGTLGGAAAEVGFVWFFVSLGISLV